MDVNLATAERAALEANAAGATEELRTAKEQLEARGLNAACEGLALADPPPAAPMIAHDPSTDPAVRAAAAASELARVRATRARADRWSDPSIGVRYAEERGGAERILGVFISVPLPGRRLAAESDRAAARAHMADAEHRQAQLQSTLRSGESHARLRTATSQWGPLTEAAKQQSQAAKQAWTAYTLGESDLATALVAMRSARSAQANAQACAVEAWHASSLLRALLESQ
jgi:outer membrane protein TolC